MQHTQSTKRTKVPINHAHTYLVSYYGPAQVIKDPDERDEPETMRVRAVTATRALSAAMTTLTRQRAAAGATPSKRDFMLLEAKVVA